MQNFVALQKHQYAINAEYAQYVPGLSFGSKQVNSLFAISKWRQGSINAAQVADCAVQHEIIVFTCHSTFSRFK
jgi:hypothetical protein